MVSQVSVIILFFFFLSALANEVDKSVFLGIGIVYGSCLEVVNRDHPLVTCRLIFTTEKEVALRFLFALLVHEHGHTDHESWTLVTRLLRFHYSVYERKLYESHILVSIELLVVVVVPLERVLGQRTQTFANIFVD